MDYEEETPHVRATLSFDLPHAHHDLIIALAGSRFALAVFRFGEFLRRYDKHIPLGEEEQKLLDKIRAEWRDETSDLPEVE